MSDEFPDDVGDIDDPELPDDPIVAMVVEQQRLAQRQDEIEAAISDLAELVRALVEEKSRKTSIWWSALTQKEARELWGKLLQFVDELAGRYDNFDVAWCWYQHPRVVDLMTALYWEWQGDYKTGAPHYRPLNFQRQELGPAIDAIRKITASCRPTECNAEQIKRYGVTMIRNSAHTDHRPGSSRDQWDERAYLDHRSSYVENEITHLPDGTPRPKVQVVVSKGQ